MDIPPDALGFAVVIATLLGTVFGVKLLVWGRGPIKRLRSGSHTGAIDDRLAELEDHVRQLSEHVRDQSMQLEDYHERLDFAERMLTQRCEEEAKGLEPPPS